MSVTRRLLMERLVRIWNISWDNPAHITWVRELFLADDHRPAVQRVDGTGRVRALIYGPYIRLPLGNWSAEVVLGFSQKATDVTFVVDVLSAGSQLTVTSLRPPPRESIRSI
jgi:hypothetical protein